MKEIIKSEGPAITMDSLELVEFINSQRGESEAALAHSDFLKKVSVVLGGVAGNFSSYYIASNGKQNPCYRLPKREACLMAMSYSYDLQAKVFDRMTALEAGTPAIPQTMAQALRLAADQAEQIELQQAQLALAIATKSQIGSKREATAMATASTAKREAEKLKDQLGFNARHATVIAVEKASGCKLGKQDWRPLRKWCDAHGVEAVSVHDSRYGAVKAWPADAWGEVHGIDLEELFGVSV